jgi:hypothetical protein
MRVLDFVALLFRLTALGCLVLTVVYPDEFE